MCFDNKEKMTDKDWNSLTYMSKEGDNWGDPSKMSRLLVYKAEAMRIEADKPLVLSTAAYSTSGHSPTGYHPKGEALDGRIKGLTLFEMYLLAEKFGFTGIGLYPNPNSPHGPFFHIDVRKPEPFVRQARWIAVPKENGESGWNYLPMTAENMKEYVI